jgi:hypothetical protein
VPVRRILPAAVALTVLLAACGSQGTSQGASPSGEPATVTVSPSPPASPSPSRAEPSPAPSPTPGGTTPEGYALIALCTVEIDLRRGEVDRAEATFEDEVHETLHELAHAVEEVDREVAAALLVAKAKVEAGFAEPAVQASAQRRAVAGLIDEMRGTMAELDIDQPACPA